MEFYSVIEKNKVLIHIATGMNLKNIMLSERGQTRKVTYFWFHLCEMSKQQQIHRQKVDSSLPGAGGEG